MTGPLHHWRSCDDSGAKKSNEALQRALHVRRRRRRHLDRRAIFVERDRHGAREQMERPAAWPAVERIVQDGAAESGAVDADLVRAAGLRAQLEPGELRT